MFQIYESRMFKAVPGGYIYQAPPLTRFHRPLAYVVDEAQKAEILRVLRTTGRLSARRVTFSAILLGVGVGIVTSLYHAPIWASVAFALESWIITAIVGFGFGMRLKLRQLEPILADLPRSDEQLFPELNRSGLKPVRPSPR